MIASNTMLIPLYFAKAVAPKYEQAHRNKIEQTNAYHQDVHTNPP